MTWCEQKSRDFWEVNAFAHSERHTAADFLQLRASSGHVLELTSEHLVYIAGKASPVPAKDVKLGDSLFVRRATITARIIWCWRGRCKRDHFKSSGR